MKIEISTNKQLNQPLIMRKLPSYKVLFKGRWLSGGLSVGWSPLVIFLKLMKLIQLRKVIRRFEESLLSIEKVLHKLGQFD